MNQPLQHPSSMPQTQSARPIEESDIEQGLDRVNLTLLRNRFTALNMRRLQRLRDSLLPQQKQFIDILPLLFHVNHPALPGYCGNDVPAGIRNFKLNNQQIKSARKLNNSFALQRDLNSELSLCGLYFMGSCSSIAHHNRSDLDIWVCPDSGLGEEQLAALGRKCQLINEWAQSLRLETHFFLMDAEAFREGQRADMTEEDCGRTQHFLLLDEFYRTSILLAGCTPLWWYVPASYENDYDNYTGLLLGKRYLDPDSCIDFGSPGQIPPAEFVSAGLWQLYKGINYPDKALLKLLLIECYAAEHPHTENLSTAFKADIYQADSNDDEFDPYLQIYRRIEQYLLARGENERLELARRCLYLKAGISLSHLPDDVDAASLQDELAQPRQWKRRLMHKLVAEWGWRRSTLLELDNRDSWNYAQTRAEQSRLTKELVRSYQLLGKLLKDSSTGANQQQDRAALNLLGRQLYAAFEHKPQKIQQLTPALVKSLAQARLRFALHDDEESKTSLWALYNEPEQIAEETTEQPLKQADDPAQLLAWAIVNGLADTQTRYTVDAGEHDLTEYELKQLAASLVNFLPVRNRFAGESADPEKFAQPAQVSHCLFIANCGIDPLKPHKLADRWQLTDKVDPLAYSGIAENLVASLTLVSVNNWGEVYSHHFSGTESLNNCLTHYFALASASDGQGSLLPERKFLCACPSKPAAIAARLSKLADDIEDCFSANFNAGGEASTDHTSPLYIFESAFGLHVFRWADSGPAMSLYSDEQALLESFKIEPNAGRLCLDASALQHHPLGAVVRTLEARARSSIKKDAICFFYEVQGDNAQVYLADTNGALAVTQLPYEGLRSLTMPIKKFVEQYTARQHSHSQNSSWQVAGNNSDGSEIACYVLQENLGKYSAAQVPMESNISANYLPVKATASVDASGALSWSILCDDQLYEQALLGKTFYLQAARGIMALRDGGQAHYRCYITDIEVASDAGPASSLVRDFNYKNQLEEQLNLACQQLQQ